MESLILISIAALFLVTLVQEYGWMNLDSWMLRQSYTLIGIAIFLEALTVPAWIRTYLDIKKRASYETIPSNSEEQPSGC